MSKNKNLTDKIIDGSVLSESESNLFAENVINRKINDYEIVSLLSFLFQNGEKYEENRIAIIEKINNYEKNFHTDLFISNDI